MTFAEGTHSTVDPVDPRSRTAFEGRIRIESFLRTPGAAERNNSVDYYLLVISERQSTSTTEFRFSHEAFLLPPEAEFWSRGKQLATTSNMRRKVEQRFPLSGESIGLAVQGEGDLAPLIPSYHIESLLPALSETVKRLQWSIEIQNPFHARKDATLTIEVTGQTGSRMMLSATMIAADQTWTDGDRVMTFNAHRTEAMVVDGNCGTIERREGKQETIVRSDNGFERKEVIGYSLREAAAK